MAKGRLVIINKVLCAKVFASNVRGKLEKKIDTIARKSTVWSMTGNSSHVRILSDLVKILNIEKKVTKKNLYDNRKMQFANQICPVTIAFRLCAKVTDVWWRPAMTSRRQMKLYWIIQILEALLQPSVVFDEFLVMNTLRLKLRTHCLLSLVDFCTYQFCNASDFNTEYLL